MSYNYNAIRDSKTLVLMILLYIVKPKTQLKQYCLSIFKNCKKMYSPLKYSVLSYPGTSSER